MRVFQIKTKLKSPKNKINAITKLYSNKRKLSPNNITQRTRNDNNNFKNKNTFKKIININSNKHPYHPYNLPSNDYSLMNTTNFTNLKTNNFIFFENSTHHKDNEIYKQIKSLIKHNSSNNISNIKFINNNKKIKKEECKRNDLDNIPLNKTHKLSISTNYSLLFKNKKKEKEKEKEKRPKLKYLFLNNLPSLTLNFTNDFNSMRKLLTDKSSKFFNNYNLDIKKKNCEKRTKSSERKRIKSNSTNKKIENKILTKKGNCLKNSKSYNDIIYSYFKNISKSTSFTSRKKKDSMNNISKINHKKKSSQKVSDNSQINLQFFKSKNKENNTFVKNKLSPISSKLIEIKSYTRKNSSKERIKFLEQKNNNTFFKDNKRIIKRKRVRIFTPEENHFLAVINVQKIKKYDKEFH